MEALKCKSCGGTLEKDGNVYICQKCGEAFKGKQNTNNIVNMVNTYDMSDSELCDVILKELPFKLDAVKIVREISGLDLKKAKDCIDNASVNLPYTYKSAIPKNEALRIAKMFSESGNIAEVIPNASYKNIYI